MMELLMDHVATPIGTVFVVSDGSRLRALDFQDYEPRMMRLLRARHGDDARLIETDDPQGFSARLLAYLDGRFDAFDDVPTDPGGTAFQRRVWEALRTIPAGTTLSYGGLAARIGAPTASRAVGLANSLNPIAIAVPCHRVIGAGGALTGYAGGMERKRWLLAHEGVRLPEPMARRQRALPGIVPGHG